MSDVEQKNRGTKWTMKKVGKLVLIAGICALLIGLTLVLLAPSSFAIWTTILSVVMNVTGITLLTTKART